MSKLNLMKDKWFFQPQNQEQSEAFQKWVFSQGLSWSMDDTRITRVGSNCIGGNFAKEGRLGHGDIGFYLDKSFIQIFPKFETTVEVVSCDLPDVESPQEKKIRELEETIAKAQEQIQALKKVN